MSEATLIQEVFKQAFVSTVHALVNDIVCRELDDPINDAAILAKFPVESFDELESRFDLVYLTKVLAQFDYNKTHLLFPKYCYEDAKNTAAFPVWLYAAKEGRIEISDITNIVKVSIMHPFYESVANAGYSAVEIFNFILRSVKPRPSGRGYKREAS